MDTVKISDDPNGESQLAGMPLASGSMPYTGGPSFSDTDDISPYTPPKVKTTKPTTGPIQR